MCLDDQVLSTYIDGELAEPWKTQVEEHLLHCSICKSRFNQLKDLGNDIKSARLREEEFTVQRERIWQYLEKNCVAVVKERFIEKRLSFKAPVFVAAAAALVLFFSAGIYFAANSKGTDIPEIPVISGQVDTETPNSIVSVRATDSAPTAMSLQDLTIEEILQLLDDRGFEVDLRLKSVEPLTVSLPVIDTPADVMEEVQEEAYYDQDGNQLSAEDVVLAEVLYDVDGNPIPLETIELIPDEAVSENPPEEKPAAP
ncbi:MAG: zf-HC2 domain-containing protein [Bacteroidetes bacterium]|nr:zf-HC2 domain-containing protein [Bacteroidota bacterium]